MLPAAGSERHCERGYLQRLEQINRARDAFRELDERWDDRLTLHGQSLIEKYVKGRLAVVLDLEVGIARSSDVDASPAIETDRHPEFHVSRLVYEVGVPQLRDRYVRKQEEVFVLDVEIVEGTQGVIPSRVWAYAVNDEVDDICSGLLYVSALTGRYKAVPGLVKWKLDVSTVSPGLLPVSLCNDQIEGGARIVNSVANNRAKFLGDLSGQPHYDAIQRGTIGIRLDAQAAEISIEKGEQFTVKVVDVLLGPFNL